MNLEDGLNQDWDGTVREPENPAPVSPDTIIMTKHQYELMLKGEGPYGKYREELT